MSEFTPGSWEASVTEEHGCAVRANGEDIAWVLSNNPADAQVMAASRDLLEALEQSLTSMLDSGYSADSVVIRCARAAIAKAKGETK